MRNYKKIKAFQLADMVVHKVYSITKNFPKEELYGLTSQIRRSAISVSTNIAEGASRQHLRDYLNFLYISRGSINETEYLLNTAYKLNYVNNNKFEETIELIEKTSKTLVGLINSVTIEIKS